MSLERLEKIQEFLVEALEAVEETKENPEPASTPIRQAIALVRELHDEANPAYTSSVPPAGQRTSPT